MIYFFGDFREQILSLPEAIQQNLDFPSHKPPLIIAMFSSHHRVSKMIIAMLGHGYGEIELI